MNNRSFWRNVWIYVQIVLLGLVQAFAYILFIVDNRFAPAGLNGIATMIQYKFGFSIGFMSLIVNVPLCVFAILRIDRNFGVNSLVFCVSNSVFYLILQRLDLSAIKYDSHGVDTIFPCIIAGAIVGFVYARCFKLSASTGGTDIISKYVCMKKPFFNFFFVTFTINSVIAIVSLFVYSDGDGSGFTLDYKPVVLCIIYCLLTGLVGNSIIKNEKKAYLFTVISPYAKEIEKEIITELKHTATKLNAEGAYTGQEVDVLLCVINKHQISDFENIIKKYPHTFSYASSVIETVGNFKRITY